MEVNCGVYISKVDALHPNQSGWVTIKKNDAVCIPDMCLHQKPTIALHRTSNDVGFVNLEHFEVARNERGERVNTFMAHAIAIRDCDSTDSGNWLSYRVGHLILLSPGPWEKSVESYHDPSGGPFLKAYNLTTAKVGFVQFTDFYWFPNAEVIAEKEILVYYADQGKYAGDRPMLSRVGDKLVVIWVSKTAPSVSKEQMFHGVRTSTGTVGWWKGLRKIEKGKQQSMRAAIEEEAQRRMPAGSNLQELVNQWATQSGSRREVQTPDLELNEQHAGSNLQELVNQWATQSGSRRELQTPGLELNEQHAGAGMRSYVNHVPGTVPAPQAGPATPSRPPNLNFVEHPPQQRSHSLQMPTYPYNIAPPNIYPVMPNAQHPPRLGPPRPPSNMPRTNRQEEEEFGPYDSAPKWNWPPGLIEYLEELKRSIDSPEPRLTDEEIVMYPWRKVREHEGDLEVGMRLTFVKKCDVQNRWGLNCWGGVIVSSSGEKKPIIIPSRVVGAVDKFDETRDAQIYDMAFVRGGPCGRHPVDNKNMRCCISYTGPHPTEDTCVLKDQDYVSRTHVCCSEDWMVVGDRFDGANRPVIVACDISALTMYGPAGNGRSTV